MLRINGTIDKVAEGSSGGIVTILISSSDKKMIERRRGREAEIGIDDGRSISPEQRRKAYATLRDISNHTGYTVEAAKQVMKVEHMLRMRDSKLISLSNCSMTEAREFINTLLEYSLKEGIIMTESWMQRTDDLDCYFIQCIRYHRCCICGRQADVHHVDTIGMGNNRRYVDDSGKEVAALCREHHTIAHQRGWPRMMSQYHIYGIKKNRVQTAEGEILPEACNGERG